MINDIDGEDIKFPVSKKDFCKIEKTYIFALICFVIKIN